VPWSCQQEATEETEGSFLFVPVVFLFILLLGSDAHAQNNLTNAAAATAASKFRSEDGWLDVSGFLDEKYGFLPLAVPITEPAVGYGAAGGVAFLSKPLGEVADEFDRPNITAVGGLGTENGTWGAFAGDSRYWLDDRLQTLVGLIYASVNLDFYGIGRNHVLAHDSLSYNLEPKGGMLQTKYRLGATRLHAGISYAFASTEVTFDAPEGTFGRPDFRHNSKVGGLTPSLTYDTRDNIFTPNRGSYVELSVGFFSQALGGDEEFQRVRLIGMHFFPLHPRLTLGVRGEGAAAFGSTPFYLEPFIYLRGAAIMRYQGEEMAQLEAELRWQFWKRFSLIGFVGAGAAWNDFERVDNSQTVVTGGTGFRYELARKYGIHVGVDLAFGPDNTAFYVQVGSAWMRP
jgi:outer membrane protein assembly factor BamA